MLYILYIHINSVKSKFTTKHMYRLQNCFPFDMAAIWTISPGTFGIIWFFWNQKKTSQDRGSDLRVWPKWSYSVKTLFSLLLQNLNLKKNWLRIKKDIEALYQNWKIVMSPKVEILKCVGSKLLYSVKGGGSYFLLLVFEICLLTWNRNCLHI